MPQTINSKRFESLPPGIALSERSRRTEKTGNFPEIQEAHSSLPAALAPTFLSRKFFGNSGNNQLIKTAFSQPAVTIYCLFINYTIIKSSSMRYRKNTLLICLLFLSCCASAQGWKWANKNSFSSSQPFEDSWLESVDNNGYIYTAVTRGSQGFPDILPGIVGHYGSHAIVDSGAWSQMIVSKIDSDGNYLWATATQGADVSCVNMTTDNKGNVYVLGMYDSAVCRIGNFTLTNPFAPKVEFFIAKYGPSGNVMWAVNVAPLTMYSGIGDVFFGEGAISVDHTSGYIYITGVFADSMITIGTSTLRDTTPFMVDLMVAKFDSTGHPIWAKGYGNVVNNSTLLSTALAPNGDLFITGVFKGSSFQLGTVPLTSATGNGIFLARLDPAGNTIWAKSADCLSGDLVNGLATDSDHNLYIIGGFAGSTLQFGTTLLNNLSIGHWDAFLMKFDPDGNVLWGRNFGGIGNDMGFSVAPDSIGNVWITGGLSGGLYSSGYRCYFGTAHIDELPGTTADDPMFIACYDKNGNYTSGFAMHGGGDDQCDIVVDNKGSFYICGDWYKATQVFGKDTLGPEVAEERTFVARYFYDTSHRLGHPNMITQPVSAQEDKLTIYPNPATGSYSIAYDGIFEQGSRAVLFDLMGKCLSTWPLSGSNAVLSLTGVPPGIYLCKVYLGDKEVKVSKLEVLK
jgi:hypothetical protein